MKNEIREIPSSACFFNVGEFTAMRKNETDKSGALRMVARSGQPIEHWFFGRVVHDLSGMQMHKPRIPVDYVHDPKEIIGYLNHFSSETGDLVATGALVPFKDSDRATEIMHKMSAGVPYEASINFGGDGLKYEEIAEGQVTQVNGYQFEGPGVVVREWPLRGVAICPYGADAQTESRQFAEGNKTIKATVFTEPQPTEEKIMENDKPDEVAPVEEPKADDVKPEAVEVKEGEGDTPADPVVPLAEAEDKPEKQEEEKKEELAAKDSRAEFIAIKKEFGAEIAATVFEAGGSYVDALRLAYQGAKSEAEALRKSLEELSASSGVAALFSARKESAIDANGVHKIFRYGTRKKD